MTDGPIGPRMQPLAVEEQDDEVKGILAAVGVEDSLASNIFSTLVRHRRLFRKWAPFGGALLRGKLPVRDREILILRTGVNCESEYEWGQHSLIALRHGFTKDELAGIKIGAAAGCWPPFEATLITAADELHAESRISDDTWATLSAHYDDEQLIEVPMVVGHYHLVAFTLNALGVQREAGVPGFDD